MYPSQSMLSLDLHASPDDPKCFKCKGVAPNGTDWDLAGGYTVSDGGEVSYTFKIVYVARYYAPQEFSGKLDKSGTTLSGLWTGQGGDSDKPSLFLFKRLSPEVMRFYPTPTELAASKPRALWLFAISTVLDQVSRRRNSWRWLQKRWETGQRYAQLIMHRETSILSPEEVTDLASCQRAMTWQQARLFNIFIDFCERTIPIHWCVSLLALTLYARLTTMRHLGEFAVTDAVTVSEAAASYASRVG